MQGHCIGVPSPKVPGMPKRGRFTASPVRLALCCLAVVVFAPAAGANAQTLHIGRSQSQSELTDRAEAVLKAAYAANGIGIVFDKYPLRRSLSLSNAGALDGEAIRVGELDPAYPNLLRLDTPITWFDMALYARPPCPRLSSKEELQGHRVAYERGVIAFERWLAPVATAEAADTGDVLKMVERGMVEYGLLVDVEGDAGLHEAGYSHLCRVHPFAERVNLYHYLNRSHQDLAARLEKTLFAMEKSGEIRRINERSGAKTDFSK